MSLMEIKIEQLIPQRAPILNIDSILHIAGNTATTQLFINNDNFFLDEEGFFSESGIMEHIAQSASAIAGYQALAKGATVPPIGYIGEIKNFKVYNHPRVGDLLTTTITIGPEVEHITLIEGAVKIHSEICAETKMKIFIEE